MKNCASCKHSFTMDICCFCGIAGGEIAHPRLMGGPKRCECYEKNVKEKRKFKYPKKERCCYDIQTSEKGLRDTSPIRERR